MFTAGPTFTRVPSRARAGGVTTSLSQTITITITLAGATGAAVAQHVRGLGLVATITAKETPTKTEEVAPGFAPIRGCPHCVCRMQPS